MRVPVWPSAPGEMRPWRCAMITLAMLVIAGAWLVADSADAARGAAPPKAKAPVAPASPAPKPLAQAAANEADEILPFDELTRERWTGDFSGMRRRRVIRVLVAYSKTFYFLDGAQQRGLTYEALKTFEDFLNRKLKTGDLKMNVRFIPVARDELLPGLVDGRGDIAAANLTITPERLEQVDFGAPFVTNVRELIVTGSGAPPLTRLEDLAGREVQVRASSSYAESLRRLSAEFERAGKRPIRIRLADENLEDEDILEMMSAGLVGITVVDEPKARFWATVFKRIQVRSDLAVRSGGSIAWAIRKGSPELRAVIDEFARKHRPGTALANVLLRRYLRDNKWVRNPTTQEGMRKFRATVRYFQQYADRYGFDYLMVTAQAYQESQLNQRLRSRAGAVGVMQVKPSTAAAPPIQIPNVHQIDGNVHAGVKYLRHIVDEYLDDPGIDSVNRGLLAFAAYNAGPARVAGLRRKAVAQGLDPNRWFGHVERVAAREIGRETVQYVSNIYKYYLAYRMVMERSAAKSDARAPLKPAETGR